MAKANQLVYGLKIVVYCWGTIDQVNEFMLMKERAALITLRWPLTGPATDAIFSPPFFAGTEMQETRDTCRSTHLLYLLPDST